GRADHMRTTDHMRTRFHCPLLLPPDMPVTRACHAADRGRPGLEWHWRIAPWLGAPFVPDFDRTPAQPTCVLPGHLLRWVRTLAKTARIRQWSLVRSRSYAITP